MYVIDNWYVYFYRLWKNNNDKEKIVYLNQQRLDEISNMFNDVSLVDVSHLVDTEVSYIYLFINKYLFNTWKKVI